MVSRVVLKMVKWSRLGSRILTLVGKHYAGAIPLPGLGLGAVLGLGTTQESPQQQLADLQGNFV